MITLLERRVERIAKDDPAGVWDRQAEVPAILKDGREHDPHLSRFLADLPLNGARSRHSLRSYGYDIVVWLRFLEARGTTLWQANRDDVVAYHRARRRKDGTHRISAASWNRAIAALDKLYRWAAEEGLAAQSPFTYRDVSRRLPSGGRAIVITRNQAYERAAKRADVKFITIEDYRCFRDVGLRGLTPDGAERPGARDRNGMRNALFADLLITTGLRLEEASSLLAVEIEEAIGTSINESGAETGMYEVPAGGRRYRALELLVKKKRLARTAPIPCIVRTDGIPEEDSLAENVQRAPLHPVDQFRAFLALREKGKSEEEIAASFFVSVNVVRQRLRLAAVSGKLLDVYADDGMTLDQLMAFTVNPDPARQTQVWEALQRSHTREAYQIRRMLTEGAVRASDKRAQFVGVEAYEDAGGIVLRDLFELDDGGWLQDPGLLDRLVAEKLEREADAVRAEGWKWVEVAPDLPYGHTYGLHRLSGEEVPLTKKETRARDALEAELDKLEKKYADAEQVPEEVDGRLGEIETALGEFEERPVVYDPSEIVRAGVFVSIGADGSLHVERGYVRPEDEEPVATGETEETEEDASENSTAARSNGVSGTSHAPSSPPGHTPTESDEEDVGVRPLSDRLMTELTAHRTLALREAVANDPDTAFLAMLHALALKLFYRFGLDSCLELEAKSVLFGAQVEGLGDMPYATAIDARHGTWTAQLPKDTAGLWDVLSGLDSDSRQALFAHCVGLTINATCQPYDRRPKAIAHAGRLAEAVQLDMDAAGWRPTIATYLGRVTKAQIVEAVREAKGEQAVQLIENLKKADMAREAERLLDGSGWLPEPLRLRGVEEATAGAEALPAFLAGDAGDTPRAIAAE